MATRFIFGPSDIVKEAIRQHKKGSIITICWHAVPPTADEPVTFRPEGPVNPDSLNTIQGQLRDDQFKDVLTPEQNCIKNGRPRSIQLLYT